MSKSGKRRSSRRTPARKGGAAPPAASAADESAPVAADASRSRDDAAPPSRGALQRLAPWATATALLVVAVAVLYFLTGATATEVFEAPPITAEDIAYGPESAELTVIEYSDFQCPFCAEYAKWMTQLRQRYGDRVRFVFRNYPLAKHEWAQFAAQAAYAASLQGKFWEMHDLLFARQDEWATSSDPRPLFDSYAESLDLDLDKFHADADAQSTVDFIKQQATAGKDAGVKHTPWFVIGDESVLPRSLEQFDQAIQERL